MTQEHARTERPPLSALAELDRRITEIQERLLRNLSPERRAAAEEWGRAFERAAIHGSVRCDPGLWLSEMHEAIASLDPAPRYVRGWCDDQRTMIEGSDDLEHWRIVLIAKPWAPELPALPFADFSSEGNAASTLELRSPHHVIAVNGQDDPHAWQHDPLFPAPASVCVELPSSVPTRIVSRFGGSHAGRELHPGEYIDIYPTP